MVPEENTQVNPVGIKGIGELASVGTAAAISNAVYNATGSVTALTEGARTCRGPEEKPRPQRCAVGDHIMRTSAG
jgi:hypothetical protein